MYDKEKNISRDSALILYQYGGIVPPHGISQGRWDAILKQLEIHYVEDNQE